jgi:hypothetical protein
MNIVPPYHAEMLLKPGDYDILVQHEGYQSARQWVRIEDRDVVLDIRLDKKEAARPRLERKMTNRLGMSFALIPAGEFLMGTSQEEFVCLF